MYNIASGYIEQGILYTVFGAQSVTYNGTTYITGQAFRGVVSVTTYSLSGTGTQLVYENLELDGAYIEYTENELDAPIFPATTMLNGFVIEYMQNANDIIFKDVTVLNGFAMELLDYPFYSFAIVETRLNNESI